MNNKDIIQDLQPYESEISDILGGNTYQEYQTGVKLDKSHVETPGMNQVEGGQDMEHTISYPLLLTTFRTSEILEKIKGILELGKVENSELFNKLDEKYVLKVDILKSWEDGNATFIGTGILTHKRWLQLERMGIRPLLYMEKGKYYKSKSGILFDFHNYKPLILTDVEDEVKNNEMVEVKKVRSLDDLEWDKIKDSSKKLESVETNKVENPLKADTIIEDKQKTISVNSDIDDIKKEIDKIASDIQQNELIDFDSIDDSDNDYSNLIPEVDLNWK